MLAAPVWAQSLNVYSEFARIDKSGHATAPATPREILSPALARNAYTSFQVVVEAAADLHWRFYVGENPENVVTVTMYRENGDALEPVALPAEGDGTQIFWMDVWTGPAAAVERIKIEPEIFVKDDWVIYPMEARVMPARVPDGARPDGNVPAAAVMKSLVCGGPAPAGAVSDRARLGFRNAQQDVALAAQVPKEDLKGLFGSCDAAAPENPESYLRI